MAKSIVIRIINQHKGRMYRVVNMGAINPFTGSVKFSNGARYLTNPNHAGNAIEFTNNQQPKFKLKPNYNG